MLSGIYSFSKTMEAWICHFKAACGICNGSGSLSLVLNSSILNLTLDCLLFFGSLNDSAVISVQSSPCSVLYLSIVEFLSLVLKSVIEKSKVKNIKHVKSIVLCFFALKIRVNKI